MTATVVTFPQEMGTPQAGNKEVGSPSGRIHIVISIDAEVLTVEAAMHEARVWLMENVSELLGVATPELAVNEGLYWRFEVIFGLPNQVQPGSGALYRIGQISLDAETGEVEDAEALAADLRVHVASLAP